MITVTKASEFGEYLIDYNHGHPVSRFVRRCIDAYKDVPEDEEWSLCPCCKMKPKIWVFDNGRSTGCGCGKSVYDHFSVYAESIMSVLKRTGGTAEYDSDSLRKNWNEYCATMVNPCSHADLINNGYF